jgi:hypothetical protein
MQPLEIGSGILPSIYQRGYGRVSELMNLSLDISSCFSNRQSGGSNLKLTLTSPTRFSLGQLVASSNTDKSVNNASPARSIYRSRLHPRANRQTPQSVNLHRARSDPISHEDLMSHYSDLILTLTHARDVHDANAYPADKDSTKPRPSTVSIWPA